MGLKEQRALEQFQDNSYDDLKKKIDEAAGFEVEIEVEWDKLVEEDMSHMLEENLPQVYFEPIIVGFQKICIDQRGRQALKKNLQKIVITNEAGYTSPDSAINFDEGVLTIDHTPNTNISDVESRALRIEEVLSNIA